MNARGGFGSRTGRQREPVDVPEAPVKDRRLDQLIVVHEHRLRRLEQEAQRARHAWRGARAGLRVRKEEWRRALAHAHRYWQDARAGFLKMIITSGKFRHEKTIYERLKQEAAQLRLAAAEAAPLCRQAGQGFFSALRQLAQARLHIEKLRMVRDEFAKITDGKE